MSTPARRRIWRAAAGVMGSALASATLVASSGPAASAKPSPPEVLYVGTYKNIATPANVTFPTIQQAVDAAKPGDYILIAPGDYHEQDDVLNPPTASDLSTGWYGGVDIETSNLHLRGMDRNTVVVDGTLPNNDGACSSNPADQNTLGGDGRNGILVWKANNVTVDNLTVCNFLSGSGDSGNEIWWNGGAGSGLIGLKQYEGSYLTATSTYFAQDAGQAANVCSVCALYGIFSSDAKGPATLSNTYASNFSDSGIYVGACHRACGVEIDNAWMEYNALGYSGTNSGGSIVVQSSRFDNNKDGFDTNTALTGDPPPPQNGACTGNKPTATSVLIPGTAINSCWVFQDNMVDHNNNADVPISGTAGLGPTGTGMTISGGRNDVVQNNQFLDNGAWGILFAPYPDANLSTPAPNARTCTGTGGVDISSIAAFLGLSGVNCLYDPWQDVLLNNQFSGNGSFGNPSNADYGNLLAGGHKWGSCFSGNTEWDPTFTTETGPATSANALDSSTTPMPASCGAKTPKSSPLFGPNTDGTLLSQAECDAGVLPAADCVGLNYPQPTAVTMQALPGASSVADPTSATLPSMNPCTGTIPQNVWCQNGNPL